jgi:hypothetical protein
VFQVLKGYEDKERVLAVGYRENKQKGDNEGGLFKILPSQHNKI